MGLALALAAAPGSAATVTLRSFDGAIAVTGELLGLDGGAYRLRTPVGDVSVPAEGVRCEGACPAPVAAPRARLGVAVAEGLGARLLPALEAALAAASEVPPPVVAPLPAWATGAELSLALGGPGLALGWAVLVPAVAPAQALRRIDMAGLEDVLAGRATSWVALGGAARPVRLHVGPGAAAILGRVPAAATLHPDDAAAAAAVAADPDALGLLPPGTPGLRTLALQGPCGLILAPSGVALASGAYPYARAIMVRAAGPGGEAALVAALGEEGAAAWAAAGIVPVGGAPVRLDTDGLALAALALGAGEAPDAAVLGALLGHAVAGAARVPVVIRPGPEGDAAIERLALDLGAGRWGDSAVLLAGFTDALGPGAANLALSRSAAMRVRDRLAARVGPARTILAEGFGELLPQGCPGTAAGRRASQRVEVWLLPPP